MKTYLIGAATCAMMLSGAAFAANPTYSTGFESPDFSAGQAIASGANEGNSGWVQAANGSTDGRVSGAVAHSGSQSLAIGNNGSGNDGVIHGVRSPELSAGAGEAQSGATFNRFESSFWFRSGDWTTGNDYFASINAWSTDRMTWVALDYTRGVFSVYASGMDGGDDQSEANDYGFLADAPIASGLSQNQWYRLDQRIDFFGNANGGDDQVTYSLFNDVGAQIGSTVTTSWDDGFLGTQRFYPAATLLPVEQLNFRTAFTTPGTGFYIDDVSYSAGVAPLAGDVPEPATWLSMIVGFGVVGGALRRRSMAVAA